MRARSFLMLCIALLMAGAASAATLTVVNVDGPNEGFNDPTLATEPAPGNFGTTIGQQRLIAFQYAANIWGAVLPSEVEILVRSAFNPLTCTATGAVLGSAGARTVSFNFDGAEFTDTLYHAALANRLSGEDQVPPPGLPGLPHEDINAQFNSNLGQPTCLAASGWYYGLDANQPANRINLVAVLLHEFAHGLGFSAFSNGSTGAQLGGFDDIYGQYSLDVNSGLTWNQMTLNSQRQASAISNGKLVWNGIHVGADTLTVLGPTPFLQVNSPSGIAGNYLAGPASFGPVIRPPGITGDVVLGLDPSDVVGLSTTDGCSPFTNAAEVDGKIALVDRGSCIFPVKVKNAQDAGAIAVLVADNVAGSPTVGLGGADPTITIPSLRISLADGNTIKAELAGGVNVTMTADPNAIIGTEPTTGLVRLYAPNPFAAGSSVSHFDTVAFPNQLMEPAINADLTHDVFAPEDLTTAQMADIGWFSDGDGVPDGVDQCLGSDPSETVVIDGCQTGVANTQSVLGATGCKISDFIEECAEGAGNHGQFVSCVDTLGDNLFGAGTLSAKEEGMIQRCAARADLP